MNAVVQTIRQFDSWWFDKRSATPLGVFRILMGAMAFLSLGITFFDFNAWYTESGYSPNWMVSRFLHYDSNVIHFGYNPGPFEPLTSAHHHFHYDLVLPFDIPRFTILGDLVTNPTVMLAFYLLVMASALLTMFGLWTRVSSAILALGVLTIHTRNPLIIHSGDTLMRLCVIYLAIGPSGAACSIDRVLKLWKGTIPSTPAIVSSWAQRLIEYQVALVYFTTVWWKFFGSTWSDGSATYYPTQLHEFDRIPAPPFILHQPFTALSTYGTMAVEFSMATLVFYKPLRKYVLIGAMMMHAYIEAYFNIPMFAAVIVSTYVCFFEGEEITSWAKMLAGKVSALRMKVFLPHGTSLANGPASALMAMDALELVRFEPGTGTTLSAEDAAGNPVKPERATWSRIIGAFPFGLVPGLWKRMLHSAIVPADDSEKKKVATKKSVPAEASV